MERLENLTEEEIINKLKENEEITFEEARTLVPAQAISKKGHPFKYFCQSKNSFPEQGYNSWIYLLPDSKLIVKTAKYVEETPQIENGFRIQRALKDAGFYVPEPVGVFRTYAKGIKERCVPAEFAVSHVMEHLNFPRILNAGLDQEELDFAIEKIRKISDKMRKMGYRSLYSANKEGKYNLFSKFKDENILWDTEKREPIFLDFDNDILESKKFFVI
jgi:hypothetical protein